VNVINSAACSRRWPSRSSPVSCCNFRWWCIGGDAGRAEDVAAELGLDAGIDRARADHAVGVNRFDLLAVSRSMQPAKALQSFGPPWQGLIARRQYEYCVELLPLAR
jgi:hypothetical protein